jgi:hypothetical protein
MGRTKITPAQLDHFELDERGRLYWQGEPVVTDQRLALSKWQNIVAGTVGLAAVAGGLGSFVQGVVVFLQYVNGPASP